MITSTKIYTEKKKKNTEKMKTDRPNPWTNCKSKDIQTKSHKEAYTYTLSKREKGKYIYIYMYIYILKKKEESNPMNKQIYQ